MLRHLFSSFRPLSTLRFSNPRKQPAIQQQQPYQQKQFNLGIAQQKLDTYLKEQKEINQKIKVLKRGHLDFYSYLGTLSLPLFVSGFATAGVILSNPTHALIPWLYSTYCNIGAMTMLGYCGMDVASLAVYNFLNPSVAQTISNKLRIGLYAVQVGGILGLIVSGYVIGPEINVILLEAVALSMISDLSIKQANAKWYQKKKNAILILYGLMFFGIFTLTNKNRESLKAVKPIEAADVSLKLSDHK